MGQNYIELKKEIVKTALKCATILGRLNNKKAAPLNSDHNLLKKRA